MKNRNILYILTIITIVLTTVSIIVFLVNNNAKKSEYSGIIEEEPKNIVTKMYTEENKKFIKKYLFRFWNLCLTENDEGIKAICGNYTKQIPKSINSFSIDQLYVTDRLTTCFVKTSLNAERYYYTILVKNGVFTIIEISREEFETYKKDYGGNYDNYTIEKNVFNSTNIADDVEASFCINVFIDNLKYNIYRAYKQLKPAYAVNRYGSYENFKKYVEENKQTLLNIRVNNSSLYTDENNNRQFVFYDRYSNIYIVEIDSNNNFYVQLDDYTLDNVVFNAVYENSSNMNKAMFNCDKFFKMLNTKDYEAAYNMLDENFKNTYFKTQSDFEKYIKTKTFSYNTVKYEEYSKPVESVHAFKITLTDATGESKEQKELNIVMMLKEGSDFVISFEVE